MTLTPIKVTIAVTIFLGLHSQSIAKYYQGRCPHTGKQCNGCAEVDQCKIAVSGVFIIYKPAAVVCLGSQVCDASAGEAACVAGAICRYKKFECPQTSKNEVFLDPYSCVEYHSCTHGKQFDYLCDPKKVFNPATGKCDKDMESPDTGCKDPPIPLCMKAGTTGTVPGTNYTYECVEEFDPYHTIYPNVTINGGDSSTTPGTGPTTLSSSTSSSSTSSSSTSSSSTSSSSTSSSSTSSNTGSSGSSSSTSPGTTPSTTMTTTQMPSPCTNGPGIYAVPSDCRKYYVCYLLPNGTLTYTEKICHEGSHFNASVGKCTPGSCTAFPTTVSQATSATTAAPVTCLTEGAVADPGCCNCYYVCYDVGGVLNHIHKCCHDGSYFSASVGKCIGGTCNPPSACLPPPRFAPRTIEGDQ